MRRRRVGDASKLRIGAMFVDNILLTVLALATGGFFAETGDVQRAVIIVASAFSYFFLSEGLWGTTLGKLLFGLQVVRTDGQPAHWREAFWRTVLRIVEVNPILLGALPGALVVLANKQNQRLGDLVAGTLVVRKHAESSETDRDENREIA